ncbi:pectinesterase inhibitor 9-like [Chenopodium quinoa]|nr:pectinesterase inhibitor 9-like [Chenopodium quinoa]XP_021748442.1 pectinesterase inhibitor 9-like [Chenopodium quinoa]
MARYTIPFLLVSISLLLLASNVMSCRRCSRARAFTIMSCSATSFPKVCEESLAKFVNSTNLGHLQLAQIALRVSITEAKFTRSYLTKLASRLEIAHLEEAQAIVDCIDQINDSVAQLRLSLKELRKCTNKVGVDDFMWYMSNVETWASTALTDQINCAATFEDNVHGKIVRNMVKAKVEGVTKVTSNALALVNRYVTRHRFSRSTHRP